MFIPFDLKRDPLQIKTDSTIGSKEQISPHMYTADDKLIGGVTVRFNSPMKYSIGHCTGTGDLPPLPVQPGDEVNKIWIIRKTNTTLSIECNGVEVLNYQFSDSNESDCETRWEEDVMKIKFTQYGTASDSYGEKPTNGNE
eukprot:sb/3474255/